MLEQKHQLKPTKIALFVGIRQTKLSRFVQVLISAIYIPPNEINRIFDILLICIDLLDLIITFERANPKFYTRDSRGGFILHSLF